MENYTVIYTGGEYGQREEEISSRSLTAAKAKATKNSFCGESIILNTRDGEEWRA